MTIVVKVGTQASKIKFNNHIKLKRAVTMSELINQTSDTDCHVVIVEGIRSDEEEQMKSFIQDFRGRNEQNYLLFFPSSDDEITCGLADELDYLMYTSLETICDDIKDKHGVDVTAGFGKKSGDIDSDDIFNSSSSDENIAKYIAEVDKQDAEATASTETGNNAFGLFSGTGVFDSGTESTENKSPENEKPSYTKIETTEYENDDTDVDDTDIDIAELNRLKMELSDLKVEYNSVVDDMCKATDRISQLEKIIETLKSEKLSLQDEFNNILENSEVLEDPIPLSEYQETVEQLESSEKTVEELESSVASLKATVECDKQTIADKIKTIDELNSSVSSLENELNNLKSYVESGEVHKEVIAEYTEKLDKIKKDKEEVDSTVSKLQIKNSTDESTIGLLSKNLTLETEYRYSTVKVFMGILEQLREKVKELEKAASDNKKISDELNNSSNTVDSLTESLNLANGQLDKYKDVIEKLDALNTELQEKKKEISKLETNLLDSSNRVTSLTDEVNSKVEEIDTLNESLAELNEQAEEHEKTITEQSETIKELEKKLTAKDDKIESLSIAVEELNTAIDIKQSELDTKVSALESEYSNNIAKFTEEKDAAINSIKAESENSIAQVRSEYEQKIKDTCEEHEKALGALQDEIEVLKATADKNIEKVKSSYEQKIADNADEYKKDLETLKAEIDVLSAERDKTIEEKDNTIAERDKIINDLKGTIAIHENTIKSRDYAILEKDRTISDNAEKLANVDKDMEAKQQEIDSLKATITKRDETIKSKEYENALQATTIEQHEAVIEDLKSEVEVAKSNEQRVNDKLAKTEARVKATLERLKFTGGDIEKVINGLGEEDGAVSKETVEAMQSEIDSLKAELKESKEEYNKINADLSNNGQALQDREAELKKANDTINSLNERIDSLQASIDNMSSVPSEEVELLNTRNKTLNEKNNALVAEVTEVTRDRDSILKKIERLESEINSFRNIQSTVAINPIATTVGNISYTGDAQIISVMGHGSYGITTLAMSIAHRLAVTTKVLYIDLDLISPKADVWFSKSPVIDIANIRNTSLGCYVYANSLTPEDIMNSCIKIGDSKGGSIYYFSGFHVKPDEARIARADFSRLFNTLSSMFTYIIVDLGKVGASSFNDSLIKAVTDISFNNVIVSLDDRRSVMELNKRLQKIGIDNSKLSWLLNMVKMPNNMSTNALATIDAGVKSAIGESPIGIIYEDPCLREKKYEMLFKSHVNKGGFEIFLNSAVFGRR
jgi:chromosome segregation ATPase